MSKHTALPWSVSTWIEQPNNRTKPMIAAKGVTIAITHPAPACSHDECEANARHIVKAVNYHHRLWEQLIDCLELMEESERRYDQGQEAPNMNEEIKYTRALLAELDNLEN